MVPEILSSVDASAIKLNDLVQNEVDSGIPLSRIIIGLYSDCTPLLFKCLSRDEFDLSFHIHYMTDVLKVGFPWVEEWHSTWLIGIRER